MKALVWYGERSIEFEEIAAPEPSPGEVIVDIELAGICGSDLHGYRGHPGPRVPPLVLGHEVVVRHNGGRYAIYPIIGCGTCVHCLAGDDNLCGSWKLIGLHRAGVFAEHVSTPEKCLVPLPEGIDARRAVLAEPLACCVGAIGPENLGPGSNVLVFGCGPIGLLTIYAAARKGAHVTAIDPVAARLEIAKKLGAAAVETDASKLPPAAANVAIDAAGFEATWRAAIDAVENGGSIVMVGLGNAEATFPMALLVRRSIRLRGQFAYSRAEFQEAIDILAEGVLDLSWLDDAPLSEGAQAFANLVDRPAEFSKILLDPAS